MKILGKLKIAERKLRSINKKSKQYILKKTNKNLDNLKLFYYEIEPVITQTLIDKLEAVEQKRALGSSVKSEDFLFIIYKKEGLFRCLEKFIISSSSKSAQEKSEVLYQLSIKIRSLSVDDALHLAKLCLSIYASEQIYQLIVDLYYENKEYYRSAYYLGFLDFYYINNKHKIKGKRFLNHQLDKFEKEKKLYLYEKVRASNLIHYQEIIKNIDVAKIDSLKNFKVDSFFLKSSYQKKNKIISLYRSHGLEGVSSFFLSKKNVLSSVNLSDYLLFSASIIEPMSIDDTEALIRQSFDKAITDRHYKDIIEFCSEHGFFELGSKLIKETVARKNFSNELNTELEEFIGASPLYAISIKDELKVSKEIYNAYTPIKNRLCYVLHNSLPYASGGYATRAHGVADGLTALGYEVYGLNRPGYPFDINKNFKKGELELHTKVDSVIYLHTEEPKRRNLYRYDYMHDSIKIYEDYFLELKPEVVIAASAYISAFPALIAARKLGIPFIYEVRGFWEVTLMSRDLKYKDTDKFFMMKSLEKIISNSADHVFTLTGAMKQELIERGVNRSKVSVIPNSCFPERFQPISKNTLLAKEFNLPLNIPVIGYIGTFVDYEGLENLTEACGMLKARGIEFRLLLVGSENTSTKDKGPIAKMIEQYAHKYDIEDWLILPGRVPHEQVEGLYSLIDIAPFPRKPWPVCEMVSPMKPLEALAMKKAVIVSSVEALQEMIIDGQTGLVFDKNSIIDLADKLQTLILDEDLRVRLGNNGREWVEKERSWEVTMSKAQIVIEDYFTNMNSSNTYKII